MISEKNKKLLFGNFHLMGDLQVPAEARGVVIFAHGSGSSRFSPRNQFVATYLNQHQIGTFLIDLLTTEENKIDDVTREFRFNIELLSERLLSVTDWLLTHVPLKISYFGASTGAAAALIATAKKGPKIISSIVSRGGRPDLAKSYLSQIHSPTLLIVGEYDSDVIELNRKAYASLPCVKKIEIVPKATHLFEEKGCLEQVAKLAGEWFLHYFPSTPS